MPQQQPSDSSSVTLPATVTTTANATDSDGSISKVDFYSNATLMTTVTTAPYSVTLAGFTLGSYTFSAVATDNSGASHSPLSAYYCLAALLTKYSLVALKSVQPH